ncbi:AraC family transcriptional regulator [Dyadobacter frigoris]|uniref:Helix-turn-helix domain-containing protein n=1 Tax=Dyadobacter frigoris TaxID=2576211 RepID=A0A4U6D2W3_9BACT|nr:helix-turn-helix transcriptional regulator [Dyadobacter frigoris]TKT90431.1 helix-turn-helix domain-containing protein [Dyadobacter frigoris]GLU51447.1 AraC family transcriptional regulator [Dyadobacter frigoris]
MITSIPLNRQDYAKSGNNFRSVIPAKQERTPLEIHPIDSGRSKICSENNIMHRHNHFEIVWITQGTGQFAIDTENYDISENLVFCLNPGKVHQLKGDENLKGFVFSFQKEFLYTGRDAVNGNFFYDESFRGNLDFSVIRINSDMQMEIMGIVRNMQRELANISFLQHDVLRGFLYIFLIYLTRQRDSSYTSPAMPQSCGLTKKFFSLLENTYTINHRVSDFASLLSITPNYLNERVKRDSGYSASHNIHQRIILEAKRLIICKNLTLKETAYHLGFDDTAYFSKFFKKISGFNFTDFKLKLTK